MAINFGRQANIARAETPRFAAAAAEQGQVEANAMAQANALRSQNLMGAGELYNSGMGPDRTPIADMLFDDASADVAADAITGNIAGTPLATPLVEEAASTALAEGAATEGAAGLLGGAGGTIAASMPYLSAALLAANILDL